MNPSALEHRKTTGQQGHPLTRGCCRGCWYQKRQPLPGQHWVHSSPDERPSLSNSLPPTTRLLLPLRSFQSPAILSALRKHSPLELPPALSFYNQIPQKDACKQTSVLLSDSCPPVHAWPPTNLAFRSATAPNRCSQDH